MTDSKSRDALTEFLDYLARKGMLNSNTASARKAAVSKVFGILDDEEARDLSAIDFEGVMQRFANLEGKNYTTDSLITYKSRAKSALDDFLSYVENPMAFRVQGGKGQKKGVDKTDGGETKPVRRTSSVQNPVQTIAPQVADFSLPIPIRNGLTVRVLGLPFDLTEGEASKIANVVKAMVNKD